MNVKYIFEDVKVYKEEKTDLGTYILLAIAGALDGGYYFKVVKKKEKEELESLEEDDFFSEAEEYEESEASETEDI